jgi:hypothetical protein
LGAKTATLALGTNRCWHEGEEEEDEEEVREDEEDKEENKIRRKGVASAGPNQKSP